MTVAAFVIVTYTILVVAWLAVALWHCWP